MWNNLNLKHFHRFNFKRLATRNKLINEGNYGLKVLETGLINPNELKALNFFIKKKLKKQGKFWLNLNPNFTKTKKPIETRMGKGKGNIDGLYCFVKRGQVILEIKSISNQLSIEILKEVKKKISLKTKILKQVY